MEKSAKIQLILYNREKQISLGITNEFASLLAGRMKTKCLLSLNLLGFTNFYKIITYNDN